MTCAALRDEDADIKTLARMRGDLNRGAPVPRLEIGRVRKVRLLMLLLDKVVCFACLHEFAVHADTHSRLQERTLSACRHNAGARAFARAQRLTALAATAGRLDLLPALTPAALPLTARSCGAPRLALGENESTARPQSNVNGVSAAGPGTTDARLPCSGAHPLERARIALALRQRRPSVACY